jgi:small subunit ribosomal protein S13
VDLPNKHVDIALTYIFGLGHSSAQAICAPGGDPASA